MSNDRIIRALNHLESLGFQVTAMVNSEGIEIIAIDPSGHMYRAKADPSQRYDACYELAKQAGVTLEIDG